MADKHYNPDMTMVDRKHVDRRSTPYTNSKMANPIVTWSLIASVVIATGTGTFFISRLEAGIEQTQAKDAANHLAAMEAIQHEQDMRTIVAGNVNENMDEIADDVKE